METRRAKRRRQAEEASEDRISQLPDVILHHILSFLTLKFIAQTGILSKRWRYIWQSYPALDFSEVSPRTSRQTWEFVLGVLRRRNKPSNIKAFRLRGHVRCHWLNRCIHHLVKHRIEELELDLRILRRFVLSPLLLTCSTLKMLKLRFDYHYLYRVKVHELRFGSLTSLSLENMVFSSTSLFPENEAYVFSSSKLPNLRSFSLRHCSGFVDLEVDCSSLEDLRLKDLTLRSLRVSGTKLTTIEVRRCSIYAVVDISAPNVRKFYWKCNSFCESISIERFVHPDYVKILCQKEDLNSRQLKSVANLFSAIACCQSLYTVLFVVKLFAHVHYAGYFLSTYINLKSLEIITSLTKEDILGLVCLLRNTPVLHTLLVIGCPVLMVENNGWNIHSLDDANISEEEYLESQVQILKPFLCNVKTVTVEVDVQGHMRKNWMILVIFLLKYGVALEEIKLGSRYSSAETRIWKEKFRSHAVDFPKASNMVKISFMKD